MCHGITMDLKAETKGIVKSIRMLEGVLKSSPDPKQRGRVKKEIDTLRDRLAAMYPDDDPAAVEEAIVRDFIEPLNGEVHVRDFSNLEFLKDVVIEKISSYRDDQEVNEAGSIMKYFEERIWGVISDQHTKLDFSNAGERDTLYRKLDQCSRSFKIFCQTIEDIEKTKSSEYISQLNMMRVKQARVFLYDISEFFKNARDFITAIVSESEFGGSIITNPDELVEYADYEKYKTFDGWKVVDALKYMKNFLNDALRVIKVPDIKKY